MAKKKIKHKQPINLNCDVCGHTMVIHGTKNDLVECSFYGCTCKQVLPVCEACGHYATVHDLNSHTCKMCLMQGNTCSVFG